jgi:hypothetical protein
MLKRMRSWPGLPAVAVAMAVAIVCVGGCLPIGDDPDGRSRVVELARAGELKTVDDWRRDWIFLLPDELDHVSSGGEVVVERNGDDLLVVFFDFRGLNHWTGWLYTTSGDPPPDDPLGNHPFKAEQIAPNWFRIDAG